MTQLQQLMKNFVGLDVLASGSPVMWLLLLCSIVSFTICVERAFALRGSKVIQMNVLREIETALKENNMRQALEWCSLESSPMLRIVKVAIMNFDKSKDEMKVAIEEAGRLEVPVLERFLTTLNTIAVISPLLGLLGTVTGMIHVFASIQAHGVENLNNLAGGISEALVTTATGLTVAIPTIVMYNFFSGKVENMIVEMERHSLTLVELLIRSRNT
ncbi:MAG: biopolymer transport protein ExbB [bacterium]|jgi:biopolymer transport protein ExbB